MALIMLVADQLARGPEPYRAQGQLSGLARRLAGGDDAGRRQRGADLPRACWSACWRCWSPAACGSDGWTCRWPPTSSPVMFGLAHYDSFLHQPLHLAIAQQHLRLRLRPDLCLADGALAQPAGPDGPGPPGLRATRRGSEAGARGDRSAPASSRRAGMTIREALRRDRGRGRRSRWKPWASMSARQAFGSTPAWGSSGWISMVLKRGPGRVEPPAGSPRRPGP